MNNDNNDVFAVFVMPGATEEECFVPIDYEAAGFSQPEVNDKGAFHFDSNGDK